MGDDLNFISNKGVRQGGVLSPHLFNVYLDYCIRQIPTLKAALEGKQVMCFADDMIIRAQNKSTA